MYPQLIVCLCLAAHVVATPVNQYDYLLDHLLDEDQQNLGPVPEVKYPVLLVPGLSASEIEARLDKNTTTHSYCAKKSDWFTIWLNPSLLIPYAIDCWVDNFKLVYNDEAKKTENTPGVETRVPGFGDVRTIEYLSTIHLPATGYYHNIIIALLKLGYKRNETLRGAPFDFRKSPNENTEYLTNVKNLIEEMYTENGNKKVIIVTHSMGGTYMYYLLLQQDQAWKDKYVRSLFTLSTPWGGCSGTLQTLAAGEDDDSSVIAKESSRLLHRSHSSFVYILPSAPVFGDTPILEHAGKNYTAADIPKILELIGDTDGLKMYEPISKLFPPEYKAPGVDIHCLRGTGTSTVERLRYKTEEDFPWDPETVRGPGDGTANQKSIDFCLKWSDEKNFKTETFDKVKHVDMVKDSKVVRYIADAILNS